MCLNAIGQTAMYMRSNFNLTNARWPNDDFHKMASNLICMGLEKIILMFLLALKSSIHP